MDVHHYQSKSGKDMILEYIESLPEDERVDALSVLENLKNNELDKVKWKIWYKRIYEVYFKKDNRIFFIRSDQDNLYLIHTCRKQKNKTELRDKKIVIKRVKELQKMLKKKFI